MPTAYPLSAIAARPCSPAPRPASVTASAMTIQHVTAPSRCGRANGDIFERPTVAAKNGIVQGYDDGTFRPYIPVTRIQMVSMVVRALELFKPGRLEQPPGNWDFQYAEANDPTHGRNVRLAEYNGLLTCWIPWGLSLYEEASRQEMAWMLYAALGGDFAPLWPVQKSDTTLAEVEAQLRSRLKPDLAIFLPRQLPAGWAIAEAPLPAEAYGEWSLDRANPSIPPDGSGYRLVFTNGTSTVEMTWPFQGDFGDGFTGFHSDGITYYWGGVHMEVHDSLQRHYWVMLRSQLWEAEAIRAITGVVARVR